MIPTIVFDLDGTLITCENKQKFALFSILNSRHFLNSENINLWWELKRNGNTTEKALNLIGVTDSLLIAKEWIRIIEEPFCCSLDTPFIDSLISIQFLRKIQYNVIILTARNSRLSVLQSIFRFGFNDHIEDLIIVNPRNSVSEKTNYLKKIKPILFIGDTESDFQASLNSNIDFTALSRGQRSTTFLEKTGINHVENNLIFLLKSDKIS